MSKKFTADELKWAPYEQENFGPTDRPSSTVVLPKLNAFLRRQIASLQVVSLLTSPRTRRFVASMPRTFYFLDSDRNKGI